MKADIHPSYKESHVKCGCGHAFTTCSTKGDIRVEICARCHPFYSGKQKFVDTAGRVQRFQDKYTWTGQVAESFVSKTKRKRQVAQERSADA